MNFELLCWVKDPRDKGLQVHNLLKAIYHAFAEHDITIPFPQRDIHVKKSHEPSFQEVEISANSWVYMTNNLF